MAHAIIAAAGSGERLRAGGPKALVEVAGQAMLGWSLRAFAAAQSVQAVVVAAPPGYEDEVRALAARVDQQPAPKVVTGGDTRSESVANALAALAEDGDPPDGIVAVHDAARPLVTPELIDATVAALGQDAGAAGVIAAEPVADTLKREAAANVIAATVSREGLWAAQTPQVFRIAALREVVEGGADPTATDEAMLIERQGWTVLLHESGQPNLKVTTRADLELADLILRGRS